MSKRRHNRQQSQRSLTFFLLISCFGILFVGCSEPTDEIPEFTMFTEEDLELAERLKNDSDVEFEKQASGTMIPTLVGSGAVNGGDTSLENTVDRYANLRTLGEGEFVVSNDFLNVREAPSVTAPIVERLERGDAVTVIEFINNAWAKVALGQEAEAYVSKRYITKRISEAELASDQAQYEGLYFVDFDFLNVRRSPDANAEKIAELPGQSIIKPLSMDNVWARIAIEGKEGYISREYLTPFLPNYSVRQSTFDLPIVQYDAELNSIEQLLQLIALLKESGKQFITLRDFKALLEQQQSQDVRLEPNRVILTIVNITPENVNDVSDAIFASNIQATAFIRSADISIEGITERKLINIQANGLDVQSATHTGDDLRSLTNAQLALELSQSRQLLEESTGKEVFAVYYPNGDTNERIENYARYNDYLFGFSNKEAIQFNRSDFLALPRIAFATDALPQSVLDTINGTEAPEELE